MTYKARGSGRWYPGTRAALQDAVTEQIERAEVPDLRGPLAAAIAPHAGYMYSGAVAGHAYRVLRDQARRSAAPDTAVVLGISHRLPLDGVALLEGEGIRTPLGTAALDVEAGAFLVSRVSGACFNAEAHELEHSAENQVPFLQAALPETRLVLALFGDHESDTITAVSEALHALARERSLVVIASTDLLHDSDWEHVASTDKETMAQMAAMDVDGLRSRWRADHQICCGLAPVLTALQFARLQGVRQGHALAYQNSGDDFPESRGQWVVGYGALAYPLAEGAGQESYKHKNIQRKRGLQRSFVV